jgi:hypothetical protein
MSFFRLLAKPKIAEVGSPLDVFKGFLIKA